MSKRHEYVMFSTTENCPSPLFFVRIPVGLDRPRNPSNGS